VKQEFIKGKQEHIVALLEIFVWMIFTSILYVFRKLNSVMIFSGEPSTIFFSRFINTTLEEQRKA